jgi:starch synthase
LNCDVRVIIPLYGAIDRQKFGLKKILPNFKIKSDASYENVKVWQAKLSGSKVIFYFLESKYFQAKKIYKPEGDNAEGFLFFSLAVLQILPALSWQPEIIHCHDFHTALVIDLLKTAKCEFYKKTKTLYTIHNLNYQGRSDPEILSIANLNKNSLATLSRDAQDGDLNFMVQGILNADLVNTVSKIYAKEIKTIALGSGLEKITKTKKIFGIVNGIDIKNFNAAADKLIYKKYSVKSLKNKIENKFFLQKKLGFEVAEKIPLVGMVTRVAWQKGFDLFTDELFALPCQFIVLGTGEKKYENKLIELSKKFPDKFKYKNYFDLRLAQQIYAGADIFLMPSQFEPCGLGQMIAMRYGTIPVVRATGGLADTVSSKVGFKFKGFSFGAMTKSLQTAIKVFNNKKKWRQLQINCMTQDFSWNKSAKEYLKLYNKLVK